MDYLTPKTYIGLHLIFGHRLDDVTSILQNNHSCSWPVASAVAPNSWPAANSHADHSSCAKPSPLKGSAGFSP